MAPSAHRPFAPWHCRFISAARDLLLSAAAQEAVTVGVPRRITAADAPKATRALFGSGGSGQLQRAPSSQGGTPTSASAASGELEEEDSLLACGEYSIRYTMLVYC
jgi:hypothetical protein